MGLKPLKVLEPSLRKLTTGIESAAMPGVEQRRGFPTQLRPETTSSPPTPVWESEAARSSSLEIFPGTKHRRPLLARRVCLRPPPPLGRMQPTGRGTFPRGTQFSQREVRLPYSQGTPRIPTVEDMFVRELKEHPRKNVINQDLTSGLSTAELFREFGKFLTNQFANSTWSGYGRTWSDLTEFASRLALPMCEFTAALFLRRRLTTQYKIGKKGKWRWWAVSSIWSQSKEISAVANRLSDRQSWQQGFLPILNRVLIKMGAKVPQHQADPIQRDQVYAFVDDATKQFDQRMLLLIAWKVAARGDDLQKAATDDAVVTTIDGRPVVVIRWKPQARLLSNGKLSTLASGNQKNSNGLGYSCVADFGAYHNDVLRFLRTRKGKPISPYSTSQVTYFLQKNVAANLTCHSIKRGALQYLLEQGVSLRLIAEVARHSNPLSWLPMVTRLYLQPVALALAIGTHTATRRL